jgi:septum formation protein
MFPIILASESKQRLIMMKTLRIPFEVIPANLDEKSITGTTTTERIKNIAVAKLKTVQKNNPDSIIIAMDSCVIVGDEVCEKPTSLIEAKKMLQMCSGKKVIGYTGVAYLHPGKDIYSTVVESGCQFRDLSNNEIDRYINNNPVLTWAGGFSPAYPEGEVLLTKIFGSLTGFSHGFPMEVLLPKLKESGVVD